jgi:hypothetical protein
MERRVEPRHSSTQGMVLILSRLSISISTTVVPPKRAIAETDTASRITLSKQRTPKQRSNTGGDNSPDAT